MKLLTRYVLFELIKVFAVSLGAMTLFMMLVFVMREALSQGLGVKHVILMMPFMLPEALRFAVPGTILFASCSVYGRLAAFNEIVAVKSMGISPMVLFWPALVLSALLSLATVWLNDVAVSWGRDGLRRIVIESVEEILYSQLSQRKSFTSKNFSIYVKGVQGHRLLEPTMTFQANQNGPASTIEAREAEIDADPVANTLTMTFRDSVFQNGTISGSFRDREYQYVVTLSDALRKRENVGSPSDMPLHEIPTEIAAQEASIVQWNEEMAAQAAIQLMSGDYNALSSANWVPFEQRMVEARSRIARLRMEPHRRWANGFSCLCFVLVGAPLAVIRRNSDFLTSFFVCFLPILLAYYPLLIFSVDKAKSGDFPSFSVWLGNLIMVAAGAWLLRRVARY
ncbi:MAG: LptF/LptG family permease [Planctomycetota bacterium]|nr:LptF/LptG family permease [Planctomycetota bacterium]